MSTSSAQNIHSTTTQTFYQPTVLSPSKSVSKMDISYLISPQNISSTSTCFMPFFAPASLTQRVRQLDTINPVEGTAASQSSADTSEETPYHNTEHDIPQKKGVKRSAEGDIPSAKKPRVSENPHNKPFCSGIFVSYSPLVPQLTEQIIQRRQAQNKDATPSSSQKNLSDFIPYTSPGSNFTDMNEKAKASSRRANLWNWDQCTHNLATALSTKKHDIALVDHTLLDMIEHLHNDIQRKDPTALKEKFNYIMQYKNYLQPNQIKCLNEIAQQQGFPPIS